MPLDNPSYSILVYEILVTPPQHNQASAALFNTLAAQSCALPRYIPWWEFHGFDL